MMPGGVNKTHKAIRDETLHTIDKASSELYFSYCSPLWDNCGVLFKQKDTKKKAAKVVSSQNRAMVVTEGSLDVNSLDRF